MDMGQTNKQTDGRTPASVNINNYYYNNNDNAYGVVLMTVVTARVHPVHLMDAD